MVVEKRLTGITAGRPEGDGIAGAGLVMVIYFFSGLCSLIDEVVWVRLLKLTLGNTVYASSIVVSVFMGGLALGALIISRYADSVRRPLRLYAVLEVCAAGSALSLPFALRFADKAYRWFYLAYKPDTAALMGVQVVVSAVILLIPTMVMGSTLPILGRYVTTRIDGVGRFVGRLYALNTLGAALGCFLAGFVLIRLAGVMGTLYIAAVVNVLVAAAAGVLSVRCDVAETEPIQGEAETKSEAGGWKNAKAVHYLLLLAFFSSGLISIGYELIWMRSIVILLGGFTYVFSAVLTVYLLGNVIGAWLGSGLAKILKQPAVGFGISLTALGIMGVFYLPWLSVWYLRLSPFIVDGFFGGFPEFYGKFAIVLPLFHCLFLFLIPALTMGVGFPLALQAWSNYRHKVGRTTGTVYGVNTIGAVLGGVITGFLLIRLAGTQLSIILLGLAGIWLGAVMIQFFTTGLNRLLRMAFVGSAVGLTIAAVALPADMFERKIVGFSKNETIAVKDGITTTVSVKTNVQGNLILYSDGVDVAGDDLHRVAQKMLGHLGPLLNKNTEDVLSIGFGSGETTASLARHEIRRIDCVEIAPELVEVAIEYFKHINLGDRLAEKVNMIYMDCKNYLHLTDRRYDVIINGADIPAYSGSAPLFAKEHFENAKSRLNPGGLFITKLHLASCSQSGFKSILGTFCGVFPYVTVWFPVTRPINFFYLVGSNDRQRFCPKHVDAELDKKAVKDSLEHLYFNDSKDVLSCYIGDQNDIIGLLKDFNVNSDYNPFVEFDLEKREHVILREMFNGLIRTVRADSLAPHIDWTDMSDNGRGVWMQDFERLCEVSGYMLKSFGEQKILPRLQHVREGLNLMSGYKPLIAQQEQYLFYARRALSTKKSQPYQAIMNMDILLRQQPDYGPAWLIKSWAYQHQNKSRLALEAAQKAVQLSPQQSMAWNNLGRLYLASGQLDKAVEYFRKAVNLKPTEATLHHDLAVALLQAGRFEQAYPHFLQVLRIRRFSAEPHLVLGNFFAQWGKKDQAVKEYREALRLKPGYKKARKNLNAILGR